jgi:Flp pilus assembly protein TadG
MRRSHQQGVALVEFALILPLLLILTFTTTEFGRALYEYDSVTKSVRDAARYLTTQTPGSAAAQTAAQNLVIYGYTAPPSGSPPLARGLSAATVTSTWGSAGSAPVINTVEVRVSNYQFQSIFTTVFGLSFGTVTFSDITAAMRK